MAADLKQQLTRRSSSRRLSKLFTHEADLRISRDDEADPRFGVGGGGQASEASETVLARLFGCWPVRRTLIGSLTTDSERASLDDC